MIINNLAYTVFAMLCIPVLGAIFLLLCVFLYISRRYSTAILAHLQNCPAVDQRKFLLRMGIWGRIVFVGSVSSFLAFPKSLVQKGALCANDIENFPSTLKKTLVALHHVNWILLLCAGTCAMGVAISRIALNF